MDPKNPVEVEGSTPDRSGYPVRVRRLHDPEDDEYVRSLSPSQRLAMVWRQTLDAWSFEDGRTVEPRLRRDIGRVVRGRG